MLSLDEINNNEEKSIILKPILKSNCQYYGGWRRQSDYNLQKNFDF
jgi:hypothetical protein